MEKTYTIFGCGSYDFKESELKAKYERNLSCPNGWASEYDSFDDYISKGIANHTIIERRSICF